MTSEELLSSSNGIIYPKDKGSQMSLDDTWFIMLIIFKIISDGLPESLAFQPFTFLPPPDTIKPVETVTKPEKGLEQGKRHSPSKYCSR